MSHRKEALVQGTLDLLILKALASQELHGLGVSRRVLDITRGTFHVQPGSLFPALHRLKEAGWLAATWKASENNRRAKYYWLTRRVPPAARTGNRTVESYRHRHQLGPRNLRRRGHDVQRLAVEPLPQSHPPPSTGA